jgi:transposase-like protein/ribosomal protein L37AE/L43A
MEADHVGRPSFPRTLLEFQRRFSGDEECRRFLLESRWPDGYSCPRCNHREAYELSSRALLKCKVCGWQTSATAGTVLHGSKMPLSTWFWAAYLVTTHTPGFSALQLQRQLGLNRYETAWAMLQKLRRAMVRPERDRISGMVEVDETYVGGVEEGRRGGRLRKSTKSIVAAAVEVRGRGSGRIRLAVVGDVSAASLVPFVEGAVEPGSTLLTDGWQGYAPLRKRYDHRPTTQGDSKNAVQLFPRVHRAFSNLKTWLAGTHHGVSPKHLPHYVNEFVFRFNRRRTPMAAFQSLLGLTTQHTPTTYKMLYSGESSG